MLFLQQQGMLCLLYTSHYGYSAETFLTDYPYLEADRFIDKIVEMAKNEIY